jgi:uncharacterized lipoprotein YajG
MTAFRSIALAMFVGLASCSHPGVVAAFPLEWRGVDAAPTPSAAVVDGMRGHVFHVEPFVDKRPADSPIATIEEDTHTVQTPTDVAAFCTKQFTDLLTAAGARIGEGASAVDLRAEIMDFKVIEGGFYNGEARVHFSIQSGGQSKWEGVYDGKSKRWGRSHSPDNYNEALSNSFAEVVRNLIQDDSFGKALAGP